MQLPPQRGLSKTDQSWSADASRSGNEFGDNGESADLLAALWRYRWAVILPAIVGAVAGLLVFLKTPETLMSSTKLMIESDRPAILDSISGDVIGGVPSIEILESQLFSDRVVSMAFEDERMQPYREQFDNSFRAFLATAIESLKLEPEVSDIRNAQSLIAVMSFQHTNADLCENAVKSFNDALEDFYNERHKSSRDELLRLITVAINDLHPKMNELENKYSQFRTNAPLAWNNEGEAINPHRERQLFLVAKRSEMIENMRAKAAQLAAVEAIAKQATNPIIALSVIGQMYSVKISLPNAGSSGDREIREADGQLAMLELDQQLVPLMIKRNQYANEYGEGHPTVKQLDAELTMMKAELKRIVTDQTSRLLELIEQSQANASDPVGQAKEAVAAVIYAAKAELSLLNDQIKETDAQIEVEKQGAIELAKYEQQNIGMMREVDRYRELMNQLEEQMARVRLTEEEGGTRLSNLVAPQPAVVIGPSLLKSLAIGTFLGLMLGSGLALLLEKNANTFRDADEIATMLGVPVLTHVPFFKAKQRRTKKGEINAYADLDPSLLVLHQPSSVAAEAIRSCRTSVFFDTVGIDGGKIIQVSSPLPSDGKTTVAGNLACSIAQSGKKVLAIDCDLRRPQLTDNFAMQDKLGLTNVLNGQCDPVDACHQTPLATLRVMPSGPIPANPAEALTLPEMVELLDLMREEFDYIVIDTPPLLVVTDPSITASMADCVVLTIRIRRKSKPNAKESVNILRSVGANLLGVVINNSDEAGTSDGYRGYGYYRYGRYTSRYSRRSGKSSGGTNAREEYTPMVVEGRGVGALRMERPSQAASSVEPSDEA
ncbi:Tyrosine-protein kinase ptk [Rubripirellula amarantea]|uniref:non-specific protein-tyrosine kinase n=1 Tax=Rubripirellula amarantea TaxID=2527999 RepID=A0A5C5WRI8_9BACT|nr:polysaccharide biosynthesis tyrosine autokinase [Rubripirellula amarantea]TWT52653.1 Tyrosine-protein kinase ptk [Rubripirellula amarantea]